MMGIYMLTCMGNGKKLIGSSKNYKQVQSQHINFLKLGKHSNHMVQKCFDEFGENGLKFEILQVVRDHAHLKSILQMYLNWNFQFDWCMNISKIAGSTTGTKRTAESKMKMRAAASKVHGISDTTEVGNQIIIDGDIAKIIVKSKIHGCQEIIVDSWMVDTLKNLTVGLQLADGRLRPNTKSVTTFDGKSKGTLLYHFIVGQPLSGWVVDHINKNTLDNRIINLQVVTHSQNQHNRSERGTNFHKASGKWRATIAENKKQKHLGLFLTEEDAHQAYLKAKEARDQASFAKTPNTKSFR